MASREETLESDWNLEAMALDASIGTLDFNCIEGTGIFYQFL